MVFQQSGSELRAGIREHATEVYQPTDDTFATLRVDHSLSERDGVFIRYSFDDATSLSTQASSVFRQRATSRQQYLTLAETRKKTAARNWWRRQSYNE